MKDTGVPVDGSMTMNVKVTYFDVGIDGFATPSERETKFTVHHYFIPPPPPTTFFVSPLAANLVGLWNFDKSDDLLKATLGANLELQGAGAHESAIGVSGTDGATKIGLGSSYLIDHGLSADGGSNRNTYSIIYDIKITDVGVYSNLIQNLLSNGSDGSVYISPNAGFWLNGLSDITDAVVTAGTWHRIAITASATDFSVYVDGVQITTQSHSADSNFSLSPDGFLVFADNGGEDNEVTCSSLMLFDKELTKEEVESIPDVNVTAVKDYSEEVAGSWNFNDAEDLLKASVGANLELQGAGTHESATGVSGEDGATKIGLGSSYLVDHGLSADGGSNRNTYSLVYDIKITDVGVYSNLVQNLLSNGSDGSVYISPNAGFWLNGLSDVTDAVVTAGTWHRIVITASATDFSVYVDGAQITTQSSSADSNFSLSPDGFLIFADNGGEDNEVTCSDFVVFKTELSQAEVESFSDVNIRIN